MRTDKAEAFALRKQGKSYNEIATTLKVARSTLSNWFKGHDFSAEIKATLQAESSKVSTQRIINLNQQRSTHLTFYYEQARNEAIAELEKNKDNSLFVSGVMLYWGEGDKLHKNHTRFTNTDPEMHKVFVQFLVRFGNFSTSDMRLALFLYDDLDIDTCKRYWSKQTGISKLHKPMILPGRDKRRKLQYGTATVLVMNTYFKKKLVYWIDQLPKMVLNTVSEENK